MQQGTKELILLGALLFFAPLILSETIVEDIDGTEPTPELDGLEFQVQINQKLATLPTKSDIDGSFNQLDEKIIASNEQNLAFTLGITLLNDVALIALFLLAKGRGWI